ncbi:MAG: tetratricopeptide repeat protein [Cytophagales bacterium]|nr:tetratricopeptide repeat protein [Cytophagales bacterium]
MVKKAWIAGIFLLLLSVESRGQVWKDKYLQAQDLYAADKYDQAFLLAEESDKSYVSENGATGDNYAAILRLLSTISYAQQKLPRGIAFLEKELQVRIDKKDTVYAVALTNKALFEQQLGQYEKSLNSLLECETILNQYYKSDDLPVIECNLKLGVTNYFLGDQAKARAYFTLSLAAVEKKNEYTQDILEAMYYSGMLHLETGDYSSALKTFSRTQEIYSAAGLTNTLGYPLVLYGMADAFHKMGDFTRADGLYKEALAGYERLAGKEGSTYYTLLGARAVNLVYLDQEEAGGAILTQMREKPEGKKALASATSSIASLFYARAHYARAEAYYREALALYDKTEKQSSMRYAETNLNLATLLADRGNFVEALTRIEESRKLIEAIYGAQHPMFLTAWNKLGTVFTQAGELTKAQSAFKEAALRMEALPRRPEKEWIIMTSGLAEIELRMGNYGKSDSLYAAVIKPYDAGTRLVDIYYSKALNNLAAVRQYQGRLSESLEIVRKSAAATRKLSGRSSLAYGIALENMALLRLRVGDLVGSKGELDSAMLIFERTLGKESMEYANGMISRGRYLQVTGDYTQAEPYFKGAREVIRKVKGDQDPSYAVVLNSLALLYQTLGNYRDAETLLLESKAIVEKSSGRMHQEYATAIQNLATLYQLEASYDKAEPLLKEALEIDRKNLGENHPQYAITLQNLATLYQKLGKRSEAQAMLEQVLQTTLQRFGKNHPSYITTLSNLAALYQDQGNYALAETTWKQCVELRRLVLGEDHPDYARSLYGLAGIYHAQGQWKKAKEYYEPVVMKYQKQVVEFFPALSEKEKGAFYAKIKPVFDAYQDFCIQYLRANPSESSVTLEKLYDLQLSTKAILLNATSKVRTRILASGDTELKETFKRWLGLKEEIVRYYNASQAEREQYRVDLSDMEGTANDLEKKLSAKSGAFRSQYDQETVTWKEVQRALREGEAAVEIIRIRKKYDKDSIYYIGIIVTRSSTSPELITWTLGAQLEGRRFKYHRNTIKHHYQDTISHSFYWRPLQDKLNPGTTVFLSCDGVFNKVNFNSLYEPISRRFVIDDYRVRQLSNTRELIERDAGPRSTANTASLFGYADFNLGINDVVAHSSKGSLARSLGFDQERIPVLPATEKEVDEIQKLLLDNKWDAHGYKRSEATEDNIKKSENPKLVHIATHGFFLSDLDVEDNAAAELTTNPLFRSGVLLAGAGVDRETSKSKEDGVLTAYEAMNLNLDQTELVVLSACETGLGEVRNGEGVYGLQRSFLVAGANNVLMSLWQVDDQATQELMHSFYTFWLKGATKQEAFRNAQLQTKEKYQIPYFWGAFVLIGN